jgi:hypothetical protein
LCLCTKTLSFLYTDICATPRNGARITREKKMLHTVEIARRPVAIINAPLREAEAWSASETFKKDLTVLRDADGRPLWNGEGRPNVRAASDEEIAKWDAARTAGDADEEDKAGYFAFLLPVKDPKEHRATHALRPAYA